MSKTPWRADLVLLFCGAQLLCIFFGVIAAALLHKFGVNGFKGDEDFGNILVATLTFQGATWILIPIFLKWHGAKYRDVFALRWKNFFLSIALGTATLIVVLPIALWLEKLSEIGLQKIGWQPKPQTAVELLNGAPLWPTGIYLAFFAVVLAPVAEEFIFRGVLFSFVKQLGFPKLAWIGVSLLFALIHAAAAIFIPLFILALALTWLREKTDGLLASIVTHSLFNAVNLVLFYISQKHGAA